MYTYDKKWNFANGNMKDLVHGIHSYPAMMMPLIVREILNNYSSNKDLTVLDPYMGSGTTLVEAQLYGVNKVIGIDYNPQAILIALAKTSSYDFSKILITINDFMENINETSCLVSPSFEMLDHWFLDKNVKELSRIKKYINSINDDKISLFFKLAFSETVRFTSLTRNNEFKLYRIPADKIKLHDVDAVEVMKQNLQKNFDALYEYDLIKDKQTKIEVHNMSVLDIDKLNLNEKVDMIITSPPYGDSRTTVAYGQFSRLSNEWLDIKNAQTIDINLLGGRTSKKNNDHTFDIKVLDDTIEHIKEYDKTQNKKRYPDVIAFYIDYEKSISLVAKTVKKGGFVIYVVGNRRVRNYELQTDIITVEMFKKYGFKHINTYVRDILNKRMPSKASPSNRVGGQISTMTKEYIVIMQKEK